MMDAAEGSSTSIIQESTSLSTPSDAISPSSLPLIRARRDCGNAQPALRILIHEVLLGFGNQTPLASCEEGAQNQHHVVVRQGHVSHITVRILETLHCRGVGAVFTELTSF